MLLSGKTKLLLSRWPEFTDDDHVLLNTDALLTLCEPTDKVRDAYLKKVGMSLEELEGPSDQVLLTENEEVPEGDEYEPRYIEDPVY